MSRRRRFVGGKRRVSMLAAPATRGAQRSVASAVGHTGNLGEWVMTRETKKQLGQSGLGSPSRRRAVVRTEFALPVQLRPESIQFTETTRLAPIGDSPANLNAKLNEMA